jgi:hypothetical protein
MRVVKERKGGGKGDDLAAVITFSRYSAKSNDFLDPSHIIVNGARLYSFSMHALCDIFSPLANDYIDFARERSKSMPKPLLNSIVLNANDYFLLRIAEKSYSDTPKIASGILSSHDRAPAAEFYTLS